VSDSERENPYLIKLRRLWKGTLYICVVALFVAVVVTTLVLLGWQSSLLALGLLALSQVFRYVASEVDRIGWVLRLQSDDENQGQSTTRLRRALLVLLIILVQLPNIALVAFVIYEDVGIDWSFAYFVTLVVIEILFQEIRRVNQSVAYREASYGLPDRSPLMVGAHDGLKHESRDAILVDRLDRLEKLVDEGKISRKSFEKARDRYWVRHVMESRE